MSTKPCPRCGNQMGYYAKCCKPCMTPADYNSSWRGVTGARHPGWRGGKRKAYTVPYVAQRAHELVRVAVGRGELTRPPACAQCHQAKSVQAAHYSYDDPLRVRWLCAGCHARWDQSDPKGGTIAPGAHDPTRPAPRRPTYNVCKACNASYRVRPSHAPKKSYCSRACMSRDYAVRFTGAANPNFRGDR